MTIVVDGQLVCAACPEWKQKATYGSFTKEQLEKAGWRFVADPKINDGEACWVCLECYRKAGLGREARRRARW